MSRRTKMILVYLVLCAALVGWWPGRQKVASSTPVPATLATAPLSDHLEWPALLAGDVLVQHPGYALGYRSAALQPAWTAHVLTAIEVATANEPRSNNFRPDPALPRTAQDADFEGSGYDRGHLVPAEDLAYSRSTMEASFFYSNVSPQLPSFNRGVWRRLESLVRFWAEQYDSVLVVSGPVLGTGLPTMGRSGVAVPEQFYKVLLRYRGGEAEGIGFLLKHEASSATLRSFAVSIDNVELATGLDFFPQLPNEIENRVEAAHQTEQWKWSRR